MTYHDQTKSGWHLGPNYPTARDTGCFSHLEPLSDHDAAGRGAVSAFSDTLPIGYLLPVVEAPELLIFAFCSMLHRRVGWARSRRRSRKRDVRCPLLHLLLVEAPPIQNCCPGWTPWWWPSSALRTLWTSAGTSFWHLMAKIFGNCPSSGLRVWWLAPA